LLNFFTIFARHLLIHPLTSPNIRAFVPPLCISLVKILCSLLLRNSEKLNFIPYNALVIVSLFLLSCMKKKKGIPVGHCLSISKTSTHGFRKRKIVIKLQFKMNKVKECRKKSDSLLKSTAYRFRLQNFNQISNLFTNRCFDIR